MCLLDQIFVIDNKTPVRKCIEIFNTENSSNFKIKNFIMYKLGPRLKFRILENFKNKHIMLKLSGEALMGNKDFGIDLDTINSITNQISFVYEQGIKISLVVGGGNIFRGISASSGMDEAVS